MFCTICGETIPPFINMTELREDLCTTCFGRVDEYERGIKKLFKDLRRDCIDANNFTIRCG